MSTRMDDQARGRAASVQDQVPGRSFGDNVRLGLGGLLVLALIVFFWQNREKADIDFLWMNWDMPLFLALLLSAGVGAIVSWLFSTLRARALRRSLRE